MQLAANLPRLQTRFGAPWLLELCGSLETQGPSPLCHLRPLAALPATMLGLASAGEGLRL